MSKYSRFLRRQAAALIAEAERSERKDAKVKDLGARINWLLDKYLMWAPDGTFTFPDGVVWVRATAMPQEGRT